MKTFTKAPAPAPQQTETATVSTKAAEIVRWLRRHHDPQRARGVQQYFKHQIVTLVPFARHGRLLDTAYELAREHFSDPEDLMHKAVGWLLREAGKTDSPRLRQFLLRHGAAIPRTTLRYAIERFPSTQRIELLQSTRGTGRCGNREVGTPGLGRPGDMGKRTPSAGRPRPGVPTSSRLVFMVPTRANSSGVQAFPEPPRLSNL